MPSPKTEVSELSVAFGILGVKPINPILGEKDVYTKFEGSLPYEKYKVYCERITKNKIAATNLRQVYLETLADGSLSVDPEAASSCKPTTLVVGN